MIERTPDTDVCDVFVLLDMDRTLLDSDAKIRIQCDLLTEFGVSRADSTAAMATLIGSKGSTYPESVLFHDLFGTETMNKVNSRMTDLAMKDESVRSALFYGGASRKLVRILRTKGYRMGIFTNGDSRNQLVKIALLRAGLSETEVSLPAMVTAESEKAIHVGTWIDGQTGLIALPHDLTNGAVTYARTIVVIDDKRSNIVTGSAHGIIRGIHIDNRAKATPGLQTTHEIATLLESGQSLLEIAQHHVRELY